MTPAEMAIKAHEIREDCVKILIKDGCPSSADYLSETDISLSNKMRVAAGRANPIGNRIKISVPIFSKKENEYHFFQTVTHELAHIVAGIDAGHGPIWKRTHKLFGGNAERCHNLTVQRNNSGKRVSVFCICGKEVELGPRQYKKYLAGIGFIHVKKWGGCGGLVQVANHGQSREMT